MNFGSIESILDNVSDGIQIVDTKGFVTFCNRMAASLDNLQIYEVIGKHITEVYPSLTSDNSTILKVLATGEPIMNIEQTFTTYLGNEISTINSTLPLMDEGVLIGAIEISKNITHVKKLSMRLMDLQKVVTGSRSIEEGNHTSYSFKDLITGDEGMIRAITKAMKIALNDSHIVLYGETGTGKELFAHSLHNASFRSGGPFITQNCAAIPETLLESIIFGTSKGSFTGSVDRPGLLELSTGGTLLLDEINSMPLQLQVKLLRVVQDGNFRRLGENTTRKADVRIIASLNEDPFKAIEESRLRRDLFYRLSANIIEIPPLRDRKGDVELLSRHFLGKYSHSSKSFDEHSMTLLKEFGWPGNVRELEHAIESSINVSEGDVIRSQDLPAYIFRNSSKREISLDEKFSLHKHMKDYELKLISEAYEKSARNVSKTAKLLGIPRQTLQYKLKEMDA